MRRLVLVLLMLLPVAVAHAEQSEGDNNVQRKKSVQGKIYSESASGNARFNRSPNAFLMEMVRGMKPGKALDVGMGQGRNALYLAQRGWDVTGFDIAETGVKQAREQAEKFRVNLHASVQSFSDFDFGTERWDLVVLCYVDFRNLLERVRKSLRPGGVVILECYHRDTRKMRYLLEDRSFASNELLQMFSDFRILHYEDVLAKPDWNFNGEEKQRLVRLVAQKEAKDAVVDCTLEGRPYPEGEEVCLDRGKMLLRCEKTGWERRGKCP